MMHFRELPENKVQKVGVFVDADNVGELVQRLLNDPDVLGIDRIESGLAINHDWYVVVNYAVLDLETRQSEITNRLHALTNEDMTFRRVAE
jgi:hypothetical protein